MSSATITKKQPSSVVLAGSQKGLIVIPSPSDLTRLNYFDGKFLRAEDLQLEQRYVRRLVALSNQAGCAGLVHGMSVVLGAGDSLEVTPGLAIDGNGQVLLLPQEVTLDLGELLDGSSQVDGGGEVAPGQASFGPCELQALDEPGQVLDAVTLYVILACHAEALCGEEDVYGKLCEEACVTSTDRPYVVEGIAFRAVPLTLATALKTSGAVALVGKHRRSRAASAFFADEKARIASLISGAGLESGAWCLGAEADAGDCVPIALVARAGGTTVFLDAWTVRRERMETPPRKYWYGRLAMRPWSVFLAQVLQFQCQLTACLDDVGDPGDDPCTDAIQLIRQTSQTLAELLEPDLPTTGAPVSSAPRNTPFLTVEGVAQIEQIQAQLDAAAASFFVLPRNRLLINCGIVETPAAGYLPVVPASNVTVNEQVRRWFGEGVDLRFCVVRPDFVPHALEEAQHMDRICLLQGLDDPQNLEEVDVLVPDGEIVPRQGVAGTALRAVVQVGTDPDDRVTLQGVARRNLLDSGGVEFHAAGLAEASDFRTNFLTTRRGTGGTARSRSAASSAKTATAATPSSGSLENVVLQSRNLAQAARVFSAARQSHQVALSRGWSSTTPATATFTPAATAGGSPLAVAWLTLRIDSDPFDLAVGGTLGGSLRLTALVPSDELTDVRVDAATFTLGHRELFAGVNRAAVVGQLAASGVTHSWDSSEGWEQEPFNQILMLRIERDESPGGTVVFQASLPQEDDAPQLVVAAGGSPLTMTAEVTTQTFDPNHDVPSPQTQQAATGNFLEAADVLDPANALHVLADSALDILEAGLSEAGFADHGRELLFPRPPADQDLEILARHDWVFFHRRRTKVCALVDRPVPPRPEPVDVTCQEVYRLELPTAGLDQFLGDIQGGDAVTVLNRRQADRLGQVEFEQGTDTVFQNSTQPIVQAWPTVGDGNAYQVVVIAEPEDPNAPQNDPTIQLYLDQAARIRDAVPGSSPEPPVHVDPEGYDAPCPAVAVLVVEPQAQVQMCHEVQQAFVAGLRARAILAQGEVDELVNLIGDQGLTVEGVRPFFAGSLGQVLFTAGSSELDELPDEISGGLSTDGAQPDFVVIGCITVVPRQATAEEQAVQEAQATRIHQLMGVAGIRVLDTVTTVVNGSEDLASDCPAVTVMVVVSAPPV